MNRYEARALRRRKFRWLPQLHSTRAQQEQRDGRVVPVREWLLLWLGWGVAVVRTEERA